MHWKRSQFGISNYACECHASPFFSLSQTKIKQEWHKKTRSENEMISNCTMLYRTCGHAEICCVCGKWWRIWWTMFGRPEFQGIHQPLTNSITRQSFIHASALAFARISHQLMLPSNCVDRASVQAVHWYFDSYSDRLPHKHKHPSSKFENISSLVFIYFLLFGYVYSIVVSYHSVLWPVCYADECSLTYKFISVPS